MKKLTQKNDDNQLPNSKKNGFSLPKKVGIIYSDVKREYFPTEAQYITEKDVFHDVKIVAAYLQKIGISAQLYPGNKTLPQQLHSHKPDIVLNFVDSLRGDEYLSSTIPALLELLQIPYTGAGILGKSIDCNKFLIYKLLQQNGVPIPNYQLFSSPTDQLDPTLRYPLISKLNEIHGAVEITKDAISENEKQLRERLKFLITTYNQSVIVQEFIVGREITCFLFEGLNIKVYLAEKIISRPTGKYIFASYELQWLEKDNAISYQKFHDPLLKEYIKKAFEITRMADYGKFDVRMDSSGRYYFLDSNANPAYGPKETDCAMAYILELYGISYIDILKRLLLNTMRDAAGKQLLPLPNSHS